MFSNLFFLNNRIRFRINLETFDEMLEKQMQDEEFKKEYEVIQPKMNEIRAGISQKQ